MQNIFYNLNYDYWDLITKFWPGSTKKKSLPNKRSLGERNR